MTRDEAIAELAELEPKEAQAWSNLQARQDRRHKDYAEILSALQKIYPDADVDIRNLDALWSPLYRRKQQLKNFLLISG